jgi:hypothetical protein
MKLTNIIRLLLGRKETLISTGSFIIQFQIVNDKIYILTSDSKMYKKFLNGGQWELYKTPNK